MKPIRTIDAPSCFLCATAGRVLYSKLRDRVFSVPGEWNIWRCPAANCGLLWLNPMPVLEDVHRLYDTYYTYADEPRSGRRLGRLLASCKRGYIANRFGYKTGASAVDRALGVLPWFFPGRPAELDFSMMWLDALGESPEARTPARVLDVGTGSGWLLANLRSFGWQAEGIDFDARVVARAREKGLTVHHGGLLEQRFADSSFDAVTMSHNLEHVHDPVAWLAEARRILRPGGRLSIATPNSRSLLHGRFQRHWFPLEPPRHLYLFNRAALAHALRRAGFSRSRLFTSARDASGVFLASRSIRRTGTHDMMFVPSLAQRLLARAVQLADRDRGEDLVALAEK